MTVSSFYNFSALLGYHAVYNIVAGARGLGKTYGEKKREINAGIKRGDQFIYLRRYKTELIGAKRTFFADVEHEFPNHNFRVVGNEAQYAPISTAGDKKREWFTIGFFIALSNAQSVKSTSFPKVKTIIFDEFILERGAMHYLPDEVTLFNNFYNTVDRYKDKTRVFFLANAVTMMNPYFIAWEIEPDQAVKGFIVKEGGFIVAHFPDSANFASEVMQTRFGKFIAGTEYADYAVSNNFNDNHKALVKGKTPEAKYHFSIETAKGTFSIWHDFRLDEYFIQKKLPKEQDVLTLLPERMSAEKTLVTFSDRAISVLRTAFRAGRVSFDGQVSRNVFTEVFKR